MKYYVVIKIILENAIIFMGNILKRAGYKKYLHLGTLLFYQIYTRVGINVLGKNTKGDAQQVVNSSYLWVIVIVFICIF